MIPRLIASIRAYGQYGFPFLPGPASTPVAQFRRLTGPAYLPRRRRLLRPLAFAFMALAWPLGALSTAIRLEARDTRPHRLRRILDAWRLAITRNVPPFDYHAFRLDQPAPRADLLHFVFWTDLRAFATLNARRGALDGDVGDKARFAALCEAHGLPAIPTLAAFRNGRQTAPEEAFLPDVPALWVKSLQGQGGQGATLWRRDGDHYHDRKGNAVEAHDLAGRLRQTDCIVQPRVANHASVAAITNGALASLRIITGIDAQDRATAVTAMLYLPSGDRITSIAGIGCAIDMERGILTRAIDFRAGAREIAHHPDTGAGIVGEALPFWEESLALVIRAHETGFSRFVFLGWDVALTPEGPVLLEANAGWLALHLQVLNGPLGRTGFSRIVSEHL